MRYYSIFWTLVFVLFAAVQLNDPDPEIWVPIYLYAAFMAGLAAANKYDILSLAIGAIFYLVGAIRQLPPSISNWIHAEEQAKSLQMKMPFVEEARESLGLFICFLVMAGYLWVAIQKRRRR